MSRVHAKGSEIFVDEFDYSGVINAIDIDNERPISNITAFADTDQIVVAGKPGFQIQLNGHYSTASPNYDGEMFTDLTSSNRLVTVSPGIVAVTGGHAKFGRGNIKALPVTANIGNAVMLNVTWDGEEELVKGRVGMRGAAVSSSSQATAYQLGALSTTQQMVAFLHVLSGSASTLDVKVCSDSQENFGGTPADQITFTQASGATSERGAKSGAVTDDWWRVEYTVGGGSWSFIVVLGIVNL